MARAEWRGGVLSQTLGQTDQCQWHKMQAQSRVVSSPGGADYWGHVSLWEKKRGHLYSTAKLWLKGPWLERELLMLDRAALTHWDGGWSSLPTSSILREDGGLMTWSMWRPLLFSLLAILTWWAFLEVWVHIWRTPHYIVGRGCPTWSPKSCELGSYSSPYVRIVLLFLFYCSLLCVCGAGWHTHMTPCACGEWRASYGSQFSPIRWVPGIGSKHPYLLSHLTIPQMCFKCGCGVIQDCLQNPSPLHFLRRVNYSGGTTEGFHCQSPVASLGIDM